MVLSGAEKQRRWRNNHPKEAKESSRLNHQNHRNYDKKYNQSYHKTHKKQLSENAKVYRQNNKDYISEYMHKYFEQYRKILYANHKKRYDNPKYKTRESTLRFQTKRRRKLGFVPLNFPFTGSQAHHIDKTHIVYISKELHQSIRHNVWTGKNMSLINKKAFEWLLSSMVVLPQSL